MSNAQLYIAFAIPSTIALLGVLTTLTTFVVTNNSMTKRLDTIDKRLDALDARMSRMEDKLTNIGERVAALEVRVAHLENPS